MEGNAQFFKAKFAVIPFRLQKANTEIPKGRLVLVIDNTTITQTTINILSFEVLYSNTQENYHVRLIKKL